MQYCIVFNTFILFYVSETLSQLNFTNEWAKLVLKNHYNNKNIDKYLFTEQIEIEKMLKTKLDLFDVLYQKEKRLF